MSAFETLDKVQLLEVLEKLSRLQALLTSLVGWWVSLPLARNCAESAPKRWMGRSPLWFSKRLDSVASIWTWNDFIHMLLKNIKNEYFIQIFNFSQKGFFSWGVLPPCSPYGQAPLVSILFFFLLKRGISNCCWGTDCAQWGLTCVFC